jgi:uncharacterized membrane protein YfcA
MIELFAQFSIWVWLGCLIIAFLAGVIKGMVGFAMPMILVSGIGSLLGPELALAGLILPTLITNGVQALQQGPQAAVSSVRRFRVFLTVGLVMVLVSSQLVTQLPERWFLAGIGGPIVFFALLQLLGWQPRVSGGHWGTEVGIGAFAGFIGGMSGVWGPPTVAYLTALGTEKSEQMRVQGVIYGLGAVALTAAHLVSGIFNAVTVWISLALIVPALGGMALGARLQGRIDQAGFRRATLVVLLVAGVNLLRRAVWG